MCDLSKGVREEGRVEGLAEAVTNIMKAMNKTMDEAMNLSGVDEAIQFLSRHTSTLLIIIINQNLPLVNSIFYKFYFFIKESMSQCMLM